MSLVKRWILFICVREYREVLAANRQILLENIELRRTIARIHAKEQEVLDEVI